MIGNRTDGYINPVWIPDLQINGTYVIPPATPKAEWVNNDKIRRAAVVRKNRTFFNDDGRLDAAARMQQVTRDIQNNPASTTDGRDNLSLDLVEGSGRMLSETRANNVLRKHYNQWLSGRQSRNKVSRRCR